MPRIRSAAADPSSSLVAALACAIAPYAIGCVPMPGAGGGGGSGGGGGGSGVSDDALGCVADAHGDAWTDADAADEGPYDVSSLDLEFVDTTRGTAPHGSSGGSDERTLPTMVWYPDVAPSEVPPPSGFPIVMYSHGFASTRKENTDLAEHLASHGFVVVASTFPSSNLYAAGGPNEQDAPNQPGDVSFVLDAVLALGATPGHTLEGRLDESRIAAVGLSMGGLTTLLVTYHPSLRDPRIDVAVAIAPPAALFGTAFYRNSDAPVLVMHGTIDAIITYEPHAPTFLAQAEPPAALLAVEGATHTGFTSLAKTLDLVTANVDSVGCSAIESLIETPGDFTGLVEPLGGAAAGILWPAPSPSCVGDLPDGIEVTRQLEIENAAVLSFLTAHLATGATERDQACHYFAETLPAAPELELLFP